MKETSRSMIENDIIQAYLTLGDTLRMTALPNWISAELNLSQLKAIVLLEFYGTLTISELAKLLEMSNSAASILVQQLVEQDLVERSEDSSDRRRTNVRPTARSAGLIADRRETIKTNLLYYLSQLDDDTVSSLQQGLGALARVVQSAHVQKTHSPVEEPLQYLD